jgi:hypothetical protein
VTQLSLVDPRLERLYAVTRPGSKARLLGEWLLAKGKGGASTAELAEWGRGRCSSVMERLRCDLRGKAKWDIRVYELPGRASKLYVVQEGA